MWPVHCRTGPLPTPGLWLRHIAQETVFAKSLILFSWSWAGVVSDMNLTSRHVIVSISASNLVVNDIHSVGEEVSHWIVWIDIDLQIASRWVETDIASTMSLSSAGSLNCTRGESHHCPRTEI